MDNLLEDTCRFYRETVASMQINTGPQGAATTISPVTRLEFVAGSGLAFLFLIQQVALSIFFLMASICTCFLNQNHKTSLFQNIQQIPVYLIAIPFGFVGGIIPQTLNASVLHIPVNGLIISS